MLSRLLQINISHEIQYQEQNKPIFSLSLISIKPALKEINGREEFVLYFLDFVEKNKTNYNDYQKLYLKTIKKQINDGIEITYYFIPSSAKENLLNFKITVPFAYKVFNANTEKTKVLAKEIYEYLMINIKNIKIDNGDSVRNISLVEFQKM